MDKGTQKLAVRLTEAAKILSVSPRSLWQWAKDRKVPFVRIGRTVLFPIEGLKAWLKEQSCTGTTAGPKTCVDKPVTENGEGEVHE